MLSLFVGTLTGGFVATRALLHGAAAALFSDGDREHAAGGNVDGAVLHERDRSITLMSGAVASLAILWLPDETRKSFALYAFARLLQVCNVRLVIQLNAPLTLLYNAQRVCTTTHDKAASGPTTLVCISTFCDSTETRCSSWRRRRK